LVAQLKITKNCGRCGKAEETIGTLEDAQKLMDQVQARKTSLAYLDEVISGLADIDEPPQVIVATLNLETKKYDYKVMYDLCSKEAGEGKRRGCVARVADLVVDIFNLKDEDAEPKVRKPRTKKVATEHKSTDTPISSLTPGEAMEEALNA
jgi:hypothetical protein